MCCLFLLQGHPEIVSQLVDLIGITSIMEVSFLKTNLNAKKKSSVALESHGNK